VPVVYYLTRSRHLEHPHFVEVPLASPEGLYLRGKRPRTRPRMQFQLLYQFSFTDDGLFFSWGGGGRRVSDVINHLNLVRGKGMAAMYSWSCKRYCNTARFP
jgi:hypothetical protein